MQLSFAAAEALDQQLDSFARLAADRRDPARQRPGRAPNLQQTTLRLDGQRVVVRPQRDRFVARLKNRRLAGCPEKALKALHDRCRILDAAALNGCAHLVETSLV